MNGATSVHDFERPPINEVVVGVQFAPMPLDFVHAGLFFERIREKYPKHQIVPRIASSIERFDSIAPANQADLGLQIVGAEDAMFPRIWFISEDDARLIQLQPDRLLVNWRARPSAEEYPRYGVVRQLFADAYSNLRDFAKSNDLGEPLAVQCEVSYFSVIVGPGGQFERPDRVFRWWSPLSATDENLPGRQEAVSFEARRRIVTDAGEPIGRLSAKVVPVVGAHKARAYRVELTVRGGAQGPGLAGIQSFHDLSREAIVRTFVAMTTPEMHEVWGRTS